MSYESEFKSVDLLLDSKIETRGVDAFALSVIKAERQVRKIFTHLIYQSPSFQSSDISKLINLLENNKKVYFEGFVKGFNEIYPKSLQDFYGSSYDNDLKELKDAMKIRNKIFHGQLTGKNLSRPDLKNHIDKIRNWCKTLANALKKEFGFDGFMRDSFQKSKVKDKFSALKVNFSTTNEYNDFIRNNMER